MPADYSALATIYDSLGMGDFAEQMTPRLLEYALSRDWLGRQITSLGCGTGSGLGWPLKHNYVVTAVDSAPEMLQRTREMLQANGLQATLLQEDIRTLQRPGTADMALALNVLHELESTKDWESVFKAVHTLLRAEKWFVFDMYTIEGLVALNEGDRLLKDDDQLSVFAQNSFDYDRQIQTRRYLIFERSGAAWQKRTATRALRSYAVQAVTALLQRSGFNVLHVLNSDLSRYEPSQAGINRVIIMAQKR